MQTFKFKLMQSRRNRKLHRQISAAGLAWNHCVALTRRYYKLFGKSVSENSLKKHLAKLKKREPYGYLSEFGSQALQEVVDRLFKSYECQATSEQIHKTSRFDPLNFSLKVCLSNSPEFDNCLPEWLPEYSGGATGQEWQ